MLNCRNSLLWGKVMLEGIYTPMLSTFLLICWMAENYRVILEGNAETSVFVMVDSSDFDP